MKKLFLILISTFIFFGSDAQSINVNSTVNIIQAPAGSLVPDVFMDNNGVLHMVYAKNQNAYYIRSTDNGSTFTAPVKVNSSGSVEDKMGERGPKISVGSDGVIHVAWMDLWATGVNTYARYSRSINGGVSFEAAKAVSTTTGIDGVTVAADGNNHVVVFWHVNAPAQSAIPAATWLHMARSANNGVSFSADTNLLITNHSGLACTMCMTRARFGTGGKIYLGFRSAVDSIRDFYVLKGNAGSNNFTAVRVNTDNWKLDYCPMNGPELQICQGKQYCAFMSSNHVYWAVSDSNVTVFTKHVATPLNETDEIYPTSVANNSGKVLMVWQVGPMSVSDSATVKYAVYNTNGTFTGQQATIARTFSGTKATAFVGTDNNFYIVVAADKLTTAVPIVQDASTVSVFPNPANELLNITGITEKTTIKLYDMHGKLVLEKELFNNTTMNTSELSKGMYTIEIKGRTSSALKKELLIK